MKSCNYLQGLSRRSIELSLFFLLRSDAILQMPTGSTILPSTLTPLHALSKLYGGDFKAARVSLVDLGSFDIGLTACGRSGDYGGLTTIVIPCW